MFLGSMIIEFRCVVTEEWVETMAVIDLPLSSCALTNRGLLACGLSMTSTSHACQDQNLMCIYNILYCSIK